MDWHEWISVPAERDNPTAAFLSGLTMPAPDMREKMTLPLDSSVASSNSWFPPVGGCIGMEYCQTILPSRTMKMDCSCGLRVSHSPA
jgi:hypothetical protein